MSKSFTQFDKDKEEIKLIGLVKLFLQFCVPGVLL